MISNERPSPYGRRPYEGQVHEQTPRPFVQEDTLKNAEIQIERKFFTISLKENPRGRFLRITEDTGGKRNTIIVPTTGLTDFSRIVGEMVKAVETLPASAKAPAPEEDSDSFGNR